MAMQPQINGNLYSHTSLEIFIGSRNFLLNGVKSLNYDMDLDPGEFFGTDVESLGRTSGQAKHSGSMELTVFEMDNVRDMLGPGYMRRPFDLTISYVEPGLPRRTIRLYGIRIKKEGESSSAGNETTMAKIDLSIMRSTINGISPT